MPLPSFPKECLNDLLSFLDDSTLYNCLFINRYLCRLSVPLIWRDPFRRDKLGNLLISTLFSCLNEDEYFLSAVHFNNFNNQTPLFEYGKFIKIIRHEYCIYGIEEWLNSLDSLNSSNSHTSKRRKKRIQKCVNSSNSHTSKKRIKKIQKCVNAIYHIIMRQGSNLQELVLNFPNYFPTISIFTTYKVGITNLKSLTIGIDMSNQKVIEFLNVVSKSCRIVNCELCVFITGSLELNSVCVKSLLNFFMLQPLEKLLVIFNGDGSNDKDIKKITDTLDSLKFRSETLKELIFRHMDFQCINPSFISKLKRLERLEFAECIGFASQHYEALFKNKLHLKGLKLWHNDDQVYEFNGFGSKSNVMKAMINSLCGEELLKLSLNIVTPETVRAVKESCPNISNLKIKIYSGQFLESIIQLICELSSLKILNIVTDADSEYRMIEIYYNILFRTLGDYLTSVECLLLKSYVDLPSFEYFTNNCRANLKMLVIGREDFNISRLKCVDNFQSVHNSLKLLGIEDFEVVFWTNEELDVINSLKNRGVDIVSSQTLFKRFEN